MQDWMLQTILITSAEPAAQINFNRREQQILSLLRKGFSINDIAVKMKLSSNTIAAYRSKMLKKSGARSIVQLLNRANDY